MPGGRGGGQEARAARGGEKRISEDAAGWDMRRDGHRDWATVRGVWDIYLEDLGRTSATDRGRPRKESMARPTHTSIEYQIKPATVVGTGFEGAREPNEHYEVSVSPHSPT